MVSQVLETRLPVPAQRNTPNNALIVRNNDVKFRRLWTDLDGLPGRSSGQGTGHLDWRRQPKKSVLAISVCIGLEDPAGRGENYFLTY